MKVFLENFSKKDIQKIVDAVQDIELVSTIEESEFWFPNTIKTEDVIDTLVNGVEEITETEVTPEDLEQRKA